MFKPSLLTKIHLMFGNLPDKDVPTEKKLMFVGEFDKGPYIRCSSSNLLQIGRIYTIKGYRGDLIQRVLLKEVKGLFDPDWFKEV